MRVSIPSWRPHDGIETEKKGVPSVTVITSAFTRLAQARGRHLGMPAHPVVVVPHPIASRTHEQVVQLSRDWVQDVIDALAAQR